MIPALMTYNSYVGEMRLLHERLRRECHMV